MIMTTYTGAGRLSDHHYPTVAPADCPQLIHSTAIQWFAYGTYPSITTTLGMVIIVGAGVVSAVSFSGLMHQAGRPPSPSWAAPC